MADAEKVALEQLRAVILAVLADTNSSVLHDRIRSTSVSNPLTRAILFLYMASVNTAISLINPQYRVFCKIVASQLKTLATFKHYSPLLDALQHAANDVGTGHKIQRARYVPVVDYGLEALQEIDIVG